MVSTVDCAPVEGAAERFAFLLQHGLCYWHGPLISDLRQRLYSTPLPLQENFGVSPPQSFFYLPKSEAVSTPSLDLLRRGCYTS
jgi:hypothetical protein